MKYFLTHAVTIELFNQHMQGMSKLNQIQTTYEMIYNKYAVGKYWKISYAQLPFFVFLDHFILHGNFLSIFNCVIV